MKRYVVMCLVVFIVAAANTLCFGDGNRNHVCFKAIDADEDGAVTFLEFKQFFGDSQSKYDQIDLDGNGKLSHEEYHKSLGRGSCKGSCNSNHDSIPVNPSSS